MKTPWRAKSEKPCILELVRGWGDSLKRLLIFLVCILFRMFFFLSKTVFWDMFVIIDFIGNPSHMSSNLIASGM